MYKWLTIMGIVCIGFIVALLSLGYLLKENKAATNVLKQKLEQEKFLKQGSENSSKAILTFVDDKQARQIFLSQQKNIISKNLTCVSSSQCRVINTKISELGCNVPINIIGASLLKKSLSKQPVNNVESYTADNRVCENTVTVSSVCKQNLCQLAK